MKIFALTLTLLLTSVSARAASADYVCSVMNYRVDLTIAEELTSSNFWLSNDSGQTLAQGYATYVEVQGSETLLHFYPVTGETILTFESSDLVNHPEALSGIIQTTAEGFPIYDRLNCRAN